MSLIASPTQIRNTLCKFDTKVNFIIMWNTTSAVLTTTFYLKIILCANESKIVTNQLSKNMSLTASSL